MNDDDLLRAAWDARERAYAPYSSFKVGAAVETDIGVFTGANVENAAYSTSVCAERTAGAFAVAAGARRFLRVAVVAETADGLPVSPCGQCRQFLREFDDVTASLTVVSEARSGLRRRRTLTELLPDSFGPEALATAEPDEP